MQDTIDPADGILHYEDVVIGKTVAFGRKAVAAEEIIEYARAFDPQPLHLSEETAEHSIVGRLCASGFHSCAMMMRMATDEVLSKSTSLGAPAVEEVRWLKPVFPGDILSGRYTCKGKRVLKSRPHVGSCLILFEMLNQAGEVVMTWECHQFLGLRDR
jgi:acyl dehydratase